MKCQCQKANAEATSLSLLCGVYIKAVYISVASASVCDRPVYWSKRPSVNVQHFCLPLESAVLSLSNSYFTTSRPPRNIASSSY